VCELAPLSCACDAAAAHARRRRLSFSKPSIVLVSFRRFISPFHFAVSFRLHQDRLLKERVVILVAAVLHS
jgi:hypothetical protein